MRDDETAREAASVEPDAGLETGLPAWCYSDPGFFALECEQIMRRAWQIVCHESDMPERGDYATLRFLNDRIVVVRGGDGEVRAFRNVCRHRGARLLDEPFGCAGKRIVCPYHAWTYDLTGRLMGAPERGGYPDLDPAEYGLHALPIGRCGGFIFARPSPEGDAFDDYAAPLREIFAQYRTEEMRALGRVTLRERALNWKIAAENYIDALHLPGAHPTLSRLLGESYTLHRDGGASRITARLQDAPGLSWSARLYRALLPDVPELSEPLRDAWNYVMVWPNLAFDLYPDQIDFMQFIPISPSAVLLREIPYAHPSEDRRMRASRYLNWRINRVVNLEDKGLIERVQDGLGAPGYEPGPIATSEVLLREFFRRIRSALPVARERHAPRPEELHEMLARSGGRDGRR